MDLAKESLERGRYRRENGKVVVEVAVTNTRQLFNEQDPAPFRERDLDENFIKYVLSSVQEFPIKSKMKIQIYVRDEKDQIANKQVLQDAVHGYFAYEARLAQAKIRERLKTSRWFFLIGLICLFLCLNVAELIDSAADNSKVLSIAQEGLIIVGWVAMWRPVEVILYDWWPLREQRLYLEKISTMDVEVFCGDRNQKRHG